MRLSEAFFPAENQAPPSIRVPGMGVLIVARDRQNSARWLA
jgi:hypothetical protein